MMYADFLGIVKEATLKIELSKDNYMTKIRAAFDKCNNDRLFFFKSKLD